MDDWPFSSARNPDHPGHPLMVRLIAQEQAGPVPRHYFGFFSVAISFLSSSIRSSRLVMWWFVVSMLAKVSSSAGAESLWRAIPPRVGTPTGPRPDSHVAKGRLDDSGDSEAPIFWSISYGRNQEFHRDFCCIVLD